MRALGLALFGACVLSTGTLRADEWDIDRSDDSSGGTHNELVHGSEQLHDLANYTSHQQSLDDQDWYLLAQQPYASYEVVVDSTAARLNVLDLHRLDGADTEIQTSVAVGAGFSRSLRWQNGGLTASGQKVRVRPAAGACTGQCVASDVYRLRFYETSYGIPRFNNTGSQVTTVTIQNPTSYTISGVMYFWSATGSLLGSSSFSLPAKQLNILALTSVPGLSNTSGSVTITHDGRYGDLVGKAVAIEASTGFTFDTLMVPRPR